MQVPSIGRIVITGATDGNNNATVAPAIITRVFPPTREVIYLVNLRVLLDGESVIWKTSVELVEEPNTPGYTCWYPPRV